MRRFSSKSTLRRKKKKCSVLPCLCGKCEYIRYIYIFIYIYMSYKQTMGILNHLKNGDFTNNAPWEKWRSSSMRHWGSLGPGWLGFSTLAPLGPENGCLPGVVGVTHLHKKHPKHTRTYQNIPEHTRTLVQGG